MFCPFTKGDCRKDCCFHRSVARSVDSMSENLTHCVLVLLADELEMQTYDQILRSEDQSSKSGIPKN